MVSEADSHHHSLQYLYSCSFNICLLAAGGQRLIVKQPPKQQQRISGKGSITGWNQAVHTIS